MFDPAKGGLPLSVPCGQCIGCRVERSRQWALRCVHEAQFHERNSFVTLTYAPEHLPADGGLHVAEWQKFAKRLRKAFGPFRFFHCGEYGEETRRPHYHACIFGLDFREDRVAIKKGLFFSPKLGEVWGLGHHSIGDLTFESAAYVARYVVGKLTGRKAIEEYARYDTETGEVFGVRPPYTTMSRRPGIGARWFERFACDVYPADEVVHQGRRFRPPRFYDGKLGSVELDQVKAKRVLRVAARSEDLTEERLQVREQVAEATLSRKARGL